MVKKIMLMVRTVFAYLFRYVWGRRGGSRDCSPYCFLVADAAAAAVAAAAPSVDVNERAVSMQLFADTLLRPLLAPRSKEEVRFPCDICNKDFSTAYTMRRHRAIHNPNFLKHQCEFCPRRFNWVDNLRSHMQGVHGVVLQQGQRGRPRNRHPGSPPDRQMSS